MCPKGMEELPPTEDVVLLLLEYFVDPLLPLKAYTMNPPLSNQQSVAKQMHAVVLLYNYYYRKQHKDSHHMEFEEFCKLAVTLKPALISHMKFMLQGTVTGSDELESQFSITEKAIRDACSISFALDATEDFPRVESLPVSKVAVLLVDSKKENCLLLFSSITNGAWSVIERSMEASSLDPKGLFRQEQVDERREINNEKLTDERSSKELTYQMAAFSAIQETTGIRQSELVVLEGHVVNSISEVNKATYFYIMQYTQQRHEGFQVPIKDVIESLQGPLIERISGSWSLTTKVDYYDVLPYARIFSYWLSSAQLGNANGKCSGTSEIPCAEEAYNVKDNNGNRVYSCCHGEDVSGSVDCEMSEEETEHKVSGVKYSKNKELRIKGPGISKKTPIGDLNTDTNSCIKRQKLDIDDLGLTCSINAFECKTFNEPANTNVQQKKKSSTLSNACTSDSVVRMKADTEQCIMPNANQCQTGKLLGHGNKNACSRTPDELPATPSKLGPSEPDARGIDDLRDTMSKKDTVITQTALRILFRKRAALCHQLRNIEAEIASCDRDINNILEDGLSQPSAHQRNEVAESSKCLEQTQGRGIYCEDSGEKRGC